MMRSLIWMAWLLQSCVTMEKMSVENRDYILKTVTSDCKNLEGSHNLFFKIQGSTLSLDLDWITRPDGTFEGDFFDPLGRIFARWKMKGSFLSFVSDFPSNLSSLEADKDGFLSINHQSLYIKSSEMGCFFSGLLPRAWAVDLKGDLTNWSFEYADSARSIEFIGGKIRCGSARPRGVKGFFASPIQFCMSSANRSGNIFWRDQFKVDWSSLDEPGS